MNVQFDAAVVGVIGTPSPSKPRPTRTKWDDKREASYEVLVRSAMRSFHTKGYAATTVGDVVAGTGYTAGAFYHHFTNKADCFWHVIAYREGLRGDWTSVAAKFDPSRTTLGELLAHVFAHFAASQEGLTEGVLVMVDFYQQHRHDAQAMAKLAATYQHWRDDIAAFVSALQTTGWIDAGRDPAVLAQQIFAYAEGLTIHAALYGRAENAAAAQEGLIDGLVKLLRERS